MTMAADLERLPDDGFRYELVRGAVSKNVQRPAGNQQAVLCVPVASK